MKIWYCICVLFFINCIISLVNDSYEVTYVVDEESDLKNTLNSKEIFFCISLDNAYFSKIQSLILSQLKNLVEDLIKKIIKEEEEDKKKYKLLYHRQTIHLIKNPFIFRDGLCFKIFNRSEFLYMRFLFSNFKYKLYFYNNDTYDFHNIEPGYFMRFRESILANNFHQLIILRKEYPYSNCLNNYRKFICLNDCFKKKHRLSKYYYAENETGIVYLRNNEKNTSSIQSDENECFISCKMESCKSFYFFSKNKKYINSCFFRALVLMSTFEFWCQLIGLACLFNNLSFYQIYMKLSALFISKIKIKMGRIKKIKKILKYLPYFRFFSIIFIILCFSVILFYEVIVNYIRKGLIKKEITSNSVVLEPLSLVICFALTRRYLREEYYYENKTLLEIEKETNDILGKRLESIFLEFQNRKQAIDWILEPKVYFKSRFNYNIGRCFRIKINLKNILNYQNLFSNTKLVVKFKSHSYLYLLPENQNFTSNSYMHDPEHNFLKKVSKMSVLSKRRNKCIDYREKYSQCHSKSNCVDYCIQTEFYRKYKNLSKYSVIDKDYFTKEHWSTVYINDDKNIHDKIKENCTKLFNTSDCEMSMFKKSIPNSNSIFTNSLELDLNYEILSVLEENTFFWYKLLMDISNLQSILFGMNVLKIFSIIFHVFRLRNRKFIYYSVNIFCVLGFSLHSFFILSQVIKNELVSSQFYEYSDQLAAPEFVFCFEIDKSLIDKNHLLTGNYLNKITNDLNKKSIFDKIEYLNESNEWIQFDEENKFKEMKFKIDAFYFFNQKCIKLKPEITYLSKKLYFKDKNTVLKIHFNRTLFSQYKKIHFYSIVKNTNQFSKPITFNFRQPYNDLKISELIDQELYKIVYNDKFNLIKNPLSLLYSESNNFYDVDSYLNNLIRNYKKSINYNTLSLPLESPHFNDIIDDDLFDQFNYQIQNISDYSSKPNPNYERSFALNSYSKVFAENDKPCFTFSINFFKRTLYITNEDNYAKLVLNLLNTLSLWLDHSPLDLYIYVYKGINYLAYPYNFILKFQKILRLILNKEIASN